MEQVYIYTQEFFWDGKLKRIVKKFLGRDFGGPTAVMRSLQTGLLELGVPFSLNTYPKHRGVGVVLSGHKTLRWAISQKKLGKFSTLIAGPNVVTVPIDYNNLVLSPEIDKYVVPAQWSVNWWISMLPELKSKLVIWAAGVEDRGELVKQKGRVLIFQKNAPSELFDNIIAELVKTGVTFEVVKYGLYNKEEYFRLLAQCRLMVYLSQSESQGLALHEAWMANIPTLVWNRGYMNLGKFKWRDDKISAPYLSDRCGIFFQGKEDFALRLGQFQSRLFQFDPRSYSLENFTDKETAKKFLSIIDSI